jgi:hypothetical protein
MKNNPSLIFSILLLLVLACSGPKAENNQTGQSLLSSSPKTNNSEASQNTVSNTNLQLKSNSSKTASVISENAALLQSPNGKVLQTLPVSTNVEVIRQKGAWFYVAYSGTKGWLHGNSIRYDNPNTNSTETTSSQKPETKSSVSKTYKPSIEDTTDSSGATAKCRDGSLSFSRNRRGTCSHHGGVAVWY